ARRHGIAARAAAENTAYLLRSAGLDANAMVAPFLVDQETLEAAQAVVRRTMKELAAGYVSIPGLAGGDSATVAASQSPTPSLARLESSGPPSVQQLQRQDVREEPRPHHARQYSDPSRMPAQPSTASHKRSLSDSVASAAGVDESGPAIKKRVLTAAQPQPTLQSSIGLADDPLAGGGSPGRLLPNARPGPSPPSSTRMVTKQQAVSQPPTPPPRSADFVPTWDGSDLAASAGSPDAPASGSGAPQQQQAARRPRAPQRPRVRWTPDEVAALELGLRKHGTHWAGILADPELRPRFHASRTQVQLKDKAAVERERHARMAARSAAATAAASAAVAAAAASVGSAGAAVAAAPGEDPDALGVWGKACWRRRAAEKARRSLAASAAASAAVVAAAATTTVAAAHTPHAWLAASSPLSPQQQQQTQQQPR
ncbi:hypothetical protein HK405_012632, partial [Cladochytrium tenue]